MKCTQALRDEYQLECWMAEMQGDPAPTPLIFAWSLFEVRYARLLCKLRQHDYQPDGRDFPEDGGEGFTCTRCGHSFTAWH